MENDSHLSVEILHIRISILIRWDLMIIKTRLSEGGSNIPDLFELTLKLPLN